MKIQSPWMGRVRGSAGNMTGCKIYDKNVMRAKAFEVSNPNTAAQQVQRGYFADLINLVSGFSPEQLRTLFPSKPKAMSRRNALSKQLAEYYTIVGTEKVIDFANIDTLGNAPTIKIQDNDYDFYEEGMISAGINWYDLISGISQDLQQVVIFINITRKEISFTNQSCACTESAGFSVPSSWEITDEINVIPLLTNTETSNPDFGSFIIKVRPEKKSK
jgi:hypothetical protein